MDEQKRPGSLPDSNEPTRRQQEPIHGAMNNGTPNQPRQQSGASPQSGASAQSGASQPPRAGQPRAPQSPRTNQPPQGTHYQSAPGMEAPAQMQSVRRARPAPIDQSLIADDFHKRLRGKPTHAAHSHSWFSGFSAGLGLIIKVSVIILLLVVFMLGGFGGGMLIGYISTTKPLTISDLMTSDKKQTTFVYECRPRFCFLQRSQKHIY